jgi:hypothetical protein
MDRQPQKNRSSDPRNRGSTLLLVVAALLLSMILGMAYMQMVRLDRKGTFALMAERDMTMVCQSVTDVVAKQLKDDLGIDATGKFFVNSEPYDYPGAVDKWLAVSTPLPYPNPGDTPKWKQTTLLTNSYVGGSTDQSYLEATDATAAGYTRAYDQPADADGDGIIDSRPEAAPIASLRGTQYYMWVRVEDNSSKINMNTGLSEVSAAGAYDTTAAGTNAPRWWYPSELDLGGFLIAHGANTTEVLNHISYRFGNVVTLPVAWGTGAAQRGQFWTGAAAYYAGYPTSTANYKRLGIDVELDLRNRNGLANRNYSTILADQTAGVMAGLPLSLREYPGGTAGKFTERSFKDALANMGVASGSQTPAYYFNSPTTSEPRHQLTTLSGNSIFATPIASDASGVVLKRNINKLINACANSNAVGIQKLSAELYKVFSIGSGANAVYLPPGITDAQALADQMAVNLVDYADRGSLDSRLTEYVNGANSYYGMEVLPFLAEVYAQGTYKATVVSGVAGNWTVTWTLQSNIGYEIEFRNPFKKAVVAPVDVHLWVNGTDFGSVSGFKAAYNPDDIVILARNSGGGQGWDTLPAAAAPPAPYTLTTKLVAASPVWPTGALTYSVELRGTKQDAVGTALTWPYTKCVLTAGFPITITETGNASATTPLNTFTARQIRAAGNADKLNMLTVKHTDWVQKTNTNTANPGAYDNTMLSTIAVDAKGGPAGLLPVGANSNRQFAFSDIGTAAVNGINELGELGYIGILGPSPTKTIADAWSTATSVEDRMLNFGGNVVVSGSDFSVPHAAMLIDRFTTYSPNEDGVDNDGDGVIDPIWPAPGVEAFMPGTINYNTASYDLLMSILPIPDPATRNTVVTDLIKYREAVNGAADRPLAAPGSRTNPGIAYLGELYNIANPLASDTLDNATLNGTLIDFQTSAAGTPDSIIDDRKERAKVLAWLAQVGAVRSDIYTAYILVRGYSNGNLTTPTVERRLIAIFDRSRITGPNDQVRILAIMEP